MGYNVALCQNYPTTNLIKVPQDYQQFVNSKGINKDMDLLANGTSIPLEKLRNVLIRLEDTITYGLIERAQFKHNPKVYQPKAFQFKDGYDGSFLHYFLHEVEVAHAKVRRYTSPDEYPFTEDLPAPVLPTLDWPSVLAPNNININSEILEIYTTAIVPQLCESGDDLNYGTSATRDIEVLQAISRRIHYGKFIAEAKFRDPKLHDEYVRLIEAKDEKSIMKLLTDEKVEEKLLKRLKHKAMIYGQEVLDYHFDCEGRVKDVNPCHKIQVDIVAKIYKEIVIPLTKKVEVIYLMNRLNR